MGTPTVEATELNQILTDIGLDVVRVTPKEIWAHCPDPEKHANRDRNASWSMNIDTGAHYCFSCGLRGSLRQLIEFVTGEVPRDLADTIKRATITRAVTTAKRAQVVEEVEPETFISEYQLDTYQEVPHWACAERNLDPDDVDFYGVRWDKRDGLYIIPVRSFDGKLLGWQEKGPKGSRYFRNVPAGMHKAGSLFGLDVFHGGRAILLESPLDACRLASAGIGGGVAAYGAHVSDEQMSLLIDNADTIVLCLDHDDAGRTSMLRLIKEYRKQARLKIVRYRPDDPKDIGDMTDGSIHRLLRRAVPVGGERRVHR